MRLLAVHVVLCEQESEQCVHMRSRSRLGRSDLGANRKRITKFLAALPATAEAMQKQVAGRL